MFDEATLSVFRVIYTCFCPPPLLFHTFFHVEGGEDIGLLCYWPSVCHRVYLLVLCHNLIIMAICICMIIVGWYTWSNCLVFILRINRMVAHLCKTTQIALM